MHDLCEIRADVVSNMRNVVVAGDLHGDYLTLQRIRKHFDPSKDLMIFLGDYADRGPKGVEVIEEIGNWMRSNSERVYALKGNHEDYADDGRPLFAPCTLRDEVVRKRGNWADYFRNELRPFIEKLYVAIIIPGTVLFVHGGVSTRIRELNDLKALSREVEKAILWSDPFYGKGERYNRRGAGVEFGEDISQMVCTRFGVKRLVRSHQPRKAPSVPHVMHNGRVITISSTSVYGGRPFVLTLPARDLNTSFNNLEEYVQPLYTPTIRR